MYRYLGDTAVVIKPDVIGKITNSINILRTKCPMASLVAPRHSLNLKHISIWNSYKQLLRHKYNWKSIYFITIQLMGAPVIGAQQCLLSQAEVFKGIKDPCMSCFYYVRNLIEKLWTL